MITNSPSSTEVEVTVIGTGGGYGESIVIKIGIDSWIIVDSCINPKTKSPLAIEYLKGINVDLKKVILVICTHWHNDHIKGLTSTLDYCTNAEFCFSQVHDLQKFLFLLELDYSKSSKGSISSTSEFAGCLELINKRGTYYSTAKSNLTLCSFKENGVEFNLFALSPSQKICNDFDTEISQLITEFGSRNTAIINKPPNDKSIALLLKFSNERVVLGADLEIGRSDQEGWKNIVNHSKVIDEHKANLYKIPHHGSYNGYLSEIFDVLVNNEGILKITPYKNSGLPTAEMLDTYSSHSENIFLTSQNIVSSKAKKRDNSISMMIAKSVKKISEIKFNHGLIRSRIDYTDKNSIWKTELFEGAIKHIQKKV